MINVTELDIVFRDCLFTSDEIADAKNDMSLLKPVSAQGIKLTVGFHPERLESHREQVAGWLNEMDDLFFMGKGEGWSFLNLCTDRHGNLWTGSHQSCEQLMLLGMALNLVVCLLPREHWSKMPGGVPYYAIKETV